MNTRFCVPFALYRLLKRGVFEYCKTNQKTIQMKRTIIPSLALSTLLFVSCGGEEKTICDCVAEETAGLIEAEKNDYKDWEKGSGLSDACKEMYESMESDPAKNVTLKAERKACPEYSSFSKEIDKMVSFQVEQDLENDPEYQEKLRELEEIANQ
jgi:hypothetical protein